MLGYLNILNTEGRWVRSRKSLIEAHWFMFHSQVLLPVGLPDEGTFDWVDQFLSKNRPLPWSLNRDVHKAELVEGRKT